MQRLVLLTILFQGATALVTNNSTEWVGEKVNGVWRNPAEKVNGVYPEKSVKTARTGTKADTTARPIFYAVIMGRLAFRHQVSLWLSSLRKIGNWDGLAVLVTDRPACLAMTLQEAKVIGKKLSSTDKVDIFESGPGYKGNLHMVKRPLAKSINMMKLEKARGWLNVKVAQIPHKVSSIIYTDEDVVIGKDIAGFVEIIRDLEKSKHTLALFRDTGASAGELHTGVVVMFPGVGTDQCLQAWGKALTGQQIGSAQAAFNLAGEQEQDLNEDNNNDHDADATEIKEDQLLDSEMAVMGPDQRALGRTKACKKSLDHDGIRILPGKFFWLPTPGGLSGQKRAEFVHFTNTGRWKSISHSKIKQYLTKIGVPEEIDPTASVKNLECAIPDGGTIADVKKGPANYGR